MPLYYGVDTWNNANVTVNNYNPKHLIKYISIFLKIQTSNNYKSIY